MLSDISDAHYISIDFTFLIWALRISVQKYLADDSQGLWGDKVCFFLFEF